MVVQSATDPPKMSVPITIAFQNNRKMVQKKEERSTGKNCENKNHESVNDCFQLTVLDLGISHNQIILDKVIESEFKRGFV